MATLKTANYLLQAADRANTSRRSSLNVASGEIEVAVIPYTLTGAEATNDILNLCVLPAGAVPVLHLCCINNIAAGTALTAKVGTAADDDGLFIAAAIQAAGTKQMLTAAPPAWVVPTPLVADTGSGNAIVFATLTLVTTPTAGVTVYFNIAYKRWR